MIALTNETEAYGIWRFPFKGGDFILLVYSLDSESSTRLAFVHRFGKEDPLDLRPWHVLCHPNRLTPQAAFEHGAGIVSVAHKNLANEGLEPGRVEEIRLDGSVECLLTLKREWWVPVIGEVLNPQDDKNFYPAPLAEA